MPFSKHPQTHFTACLRKNRQRPGAVLPLVAIMLPVMLILIAFLLNLSYVQLAQTEIQIAADAAARAGGRTLANTGDQVIAAEKAKEVARLNTVANTPFELDDRDIEFGNSIRSDAANRFEFSNAASAANSIRVNARRREGSPDGPVRMLLPGILGLDSVSIGAVSISAQVDLDISVVIDRSGSMAYADNEDSDTFDNPAAAPAGWDFGDEVPTPSRWRDAEAGVEAFLRVLTSSSQLELVSLVTYGSDAERDVPLTDNYLSITNGMLARGQNFEATGTNIGGGIDFGTDSLNRDANGRSIATKVILVLTDGIHNAGTDPEVAARRARDSNIAVFTITFSTEADQPRMRQVARIANGRHFQANSSAELIDAFEAIARSLPTLIVE